MSRAGRWFVLSAVLVAADQATKWLVLQRFAPGEQLELTGFLNLVLVFNPGAAFSFLAGVGGWQRPLLAAIALGAAVIVSVLLLRTPERRLFCTGLSLILAGAVGNLIDRVRFGHVVDFIDLHAAGWHWPAFNVADSAITVGAVLLILDGFARQESRETMRSWK